VHFPSGSTLPASEWNHRHAIIASVLLALMPFLVVIGLVVGQGLPTCLVGVAVGVGLPSLLARFVAHRRTSATLASFALMNSAVVLVHLTRGTTESHFLFFVLLPLVALYQDWLPFLVAVLTVMIHHTVVGYIAPDSVYDHHMGDHAPLTWAMIHTGFIVGLILVLLIYWNAAEAGRRELSSTIDELRATQVQLVHAQKLEAIGQLAAGIAHEINTPIQYIGDNLRFFEGAFTDLFGSIDTAGSAASDEITYLIDEVPLAISQSLNGIARVAEIVRALKGIAHPNTERVPGTDINQLIRDTVIVTRNEWKTIAQLDCVLDANLPPIEGAAGPLGQVLVNTIVNAAHAVADAPERHTGQLGHIGISSVVDGASVVIAIEDDGCGMTQEVISRAFDPFFTTKAVGRGTGQGLAISRSVVVDQHHGAIAITSEVGRGTTVTIRLPIAALDTAAREPLRELIR
jgi:signal transduction histidine kinase